MDVADAEIWFAHHLMRKDHWDLIPNYYLVADVSAVAPMVDLGKRG